MRSLYENNWLGHVNLLLYRWTIIKRQMRQMSNGKLYVACEKINKSAGINFFQLFIINLMRCSVHN